MIRGYPLVLDGFKPEGFIVQSMANVDIKTYRDPHVGAGDHANSAEVKKRNASEQEAQGKSSHVDKDQQKADQRLGNTIKRGG